MRQRRRNSSNCAGSVRRRPGRTYAPSSYSCFAFSAHRWLLGVQDALRDNYGDLPINQSQFPPSRPLMGLSLERRPSDESSASNELGLKLLAPAPGIHGLGPARADRIESTTVRDSISDMSESDDESQEVNGKHTQKAPSESSSSSASSLDVSSPSTCRTSISVNERDFAIEDCTGEVSFKYDPVPAATHYMRAYSPLQCPERT